MVCEDWLIEEEELNSTISIREGMKREREDQCRREGIQILVKTGSGEGIKLKQNPTLATAAVFFHRFHMIHSFQEYPAEVSALTCIFLAGKVEETPKKVRDICKTAELRFPAIYKNHANLVDEVMGVERVLLQVLKFDLQVEHPYKYLLEYIKIHDLPKEVASSYIQRAWTFTNDSYYTPICLLWEPQVIAVGMLHLSFNWATQHDENAYKPKEEWWSAFISELSPQLLEKVCHLVLDFYTTARDGDATQNGQGTSTISAPGPGQPSSSSKADSQPPPAPSSSSNNGYMPPPQQQNYNPPPAPSYNPPPAPPQNYNPPPQRDSYNPPPGNYGQPFAPAPPQPPYNNGSQNYGPPPGQQAPYQQANYPPGNYPPPPQPNYGPPHGNNYGPPHGPPANGHHRR